VDTSRKYVVAPHALESHAVKFSDHGIRTRVPDEGGRSRGEFKRIFSWSIAPSVMGILETLSGGVVRAGVLLGNASPSWTMNPPQCMFHGDNIVAVRSQCVAQNLFPTSRVKDEGRMVHAVIDEVLLEERPITSVFRDTANATSFVVAQQTCAHVICLPWISVLVEGAFGELPDVLPPPTVTELMRAESARPAVCHALMGDKLSGSALCSVLSDGSQVVNKIINRIRGVGGEGGEAEEDTRVETGERQQAAMLASHVQAMYASITSVPKIDKKAFSPSLSAESPENLAAFVENVGNLRSQHVSFCHKAQHMIQQRVQHLEAEVKDQLRRVEEITSRVHQVERKQNDLKFLQDKIQWMAANVSERVQLLSELYWAMPRAKSEEEKRFQRDELPMLESSAAALETEVSMLRAMAARIKESNFTAKGAIQKSNGGGKSHIHPVQVGDLRRMREMLEDHQEAIRREGNRLLEVEKTLRH
jgi:hypothetical protein